MTAPMTAETASRARATVSPPARRSERAGWRDPRLVVGLVIVAASVLLGARLLGSADDSVAVWALGADARAGTTLQPADLEMHRVRFSDPEEADRYVPASSRVPPGAILLRDVGAGELLPRAALGDGASDPLVEVPVAVPAEAVPSTVRPGSVVDVWATPDAAPGQRDVESVLVFDDVVVVATPRTGTALGPSATRQIIVGVEAAQEAGLGAALARAAHGTIVITRQG